MAAIIMTDEDRARWEPVLVEYYRSKELTETEIPATIAKIFAEAQSGWNRAPKDLDTRIKMKSGYQWKSHGNLTPRKKDDIEEEVKNDSLDEDMSENYLFTTMTNSEISWWKDRSDMYVTDFEFNESSDKPLLEQLLVEELMQRRLFRKSLQYPDRDYNKKLNDSVKRVTDIQSSLGITREQRAGILNKIDGNVAQIAVNLDEKLKEMPEILRKQYEEEIRFASIKAQKPVINVLPSREKLEALLNVDGKVSVNIDSNRISEITEEVTKEITEIKEEKEEKEEKENKELPGGVGLF